MVLKFLSRAQVAERLGVTSGSLSNLKLPAPDVLVGNTRGWTPETIDAWNARRPGHGGRPKKKVD